MEDIAEGAQLSSIIVPQSNRTKDPSQLDDFLHGIKFTRKSSTALDMDGRFVRLVLVGMHIRRGDYVIHGVVNGGRLPPPDYFHAATKYIIHQYKHSNVRGGSRELNSSSRNSSHPPFVGYIIRFLVCSDEIDWAIKELPPFVRKQSIFLGAHNDEYPQTDNVYRELARKYRRLVVDFVALTQCEHSVFSIGTFSWWIAFLRTPQRTFFYEIHIDKQSNRVSFQVISRAAQMIERAKAGEWNSQQTDKEKPGISSPSGITLYYASFCVKGSLFDRMMCLQGDNYFPPEWIPLFDEDIHNWINND